MADLVEIDSLEAIVIVDNELDPLSSIAPDTVKVRGGMLDLGLSATHHYHDRGNAVEVAMESLCCGAHGLSVLLTATKDGKKHSMLFDTGPEGEVFERNAKRLGVDLSTVEYIQLSHWHRDHSGGMLKAIEMISAAKASKETTGPVVVDLHPARPYYRGFNFGGKIVSMQADPTFSEIEVAGGIVSRNSEPHTVLEDMFLVSGFIPFIAPYELGLKAGMLFHEESGKWEKDEEMADERFLMCNLKGKGIVMLTGCSHRGVVNASTESINLLSGKVPLHAVLGGYHLATSDEASIKATVKDLKDLEPKVLLPGHCSGWKVKFEIEKEMPGRLVPCTVGSKIQF